LIKDNKGIPAGGGWREESSGWRVEKAKRFKIFFGVIRLPP
jgi:hypothetical protein